jgi:hypothetical protein
MWKCYAQRHKGALLFRDLEELSDQELSGPISGAHVLQGTVMQPCAVGPPAQLQGSQSGSTGGA